MALLLGVIALGWFGTSQAQPQPVVPLPPDVKQIDTDRYVSPLKYRSTIRWLERRWSGQGRKVAFRTIVDIPGVVAAHARPGRFDATLRGVNVSRIGSRGQIFLIR